MFILNKKRKEKKKKYKINAHFKITLKLWTQWAKAATLNYG